MSTKPRSTRRTQSKPRRGSDGPRTKYDTSLAGTDLVEDFSQRLADLARRNGEPVAALSEDGLVDRLLLLLPDVLLYAPSRERTFHRFDGVRWDRDTGGWVQRLAWAVTRAVEAEASVLGLDKEWKAWLPRLGYVRVQNAIVAGLRNRLGVEPSSFDPPHTDTILNTESGMLSLPDGRFVGPPDPDLRITLATGVPWVPGADCPQFRAAVHQMMCGRDDLIAYLQLVLGASLMPGLGSRLVVVLHGPGGANGKSTLLATVSAVLGEYAAAVAMNALMDQRFGSNHDEALAPLVSRRFVHASEGDGRQSWNLALVKRLSGGDRLPMRHIYGKTIQVRPTATLFVATNQAPSVGTVDSAMRDRLRLFPFDHTVPVHQRIPDLARRLVQDEGPGILNWLLEGTRRANPATLADAPMAVRAATQGYFAAMDDLGRYLDERTVHDPGDRSLRVRAGLLYVDYQEWCVENGLVPVSMTRLGIDLNDRGFVTETDSGNRIIRIGVELARAQDQTAAA